jgi:hypothetical protein
MSIKIMTLVWSSQLYSSGTLLVLLAMADHAGDEDWTCRPSVAALAKKARLTDRQVHRILRKMTKDGVISAVGKHPTHAGSPIVVYRINAETLSKGVKMSPIRHGAKGDIGDTGAALSMTSETAKGDIGDVLRVTPVSYDPSLEPSLGRQEGDPSLPSLPNAHEADPDTAQDEERQDDIERSVALLTDREVGCDETFARALAKEFTFEEIRRQVFRFRRDFSAGSVVSVGALRKRLQTRWAATITTEDKKSLLWQRHETEGDRRKRYDPFYQEEST